MTAEERAKILIHQIENDAFEQIAHLVERRYGQDVKLAQVIRSFKHPLPSIED